MEHPRHRSELPRLLRRRPPRRRRVSSPAPGYSPRIARIAVIGNLARDVVAGAAPRAGGGVLYGALALARLGADAAAAAACAESDRPLLVPPLEASGLPVTWHPSRTSAAFAFHYDEDDRVMTLEGVGEPWTPEQALAAADDARYVHVGALVRTDFPERTLAALSTGGRTVLVDAQGLVRTPELGPLRKDGEIGDVLRHVTILKLNEGEAAVIAGGTEVEALRSLGVPEVVLTLGSRGSLVVTQSTEDTVPAAPIDARVDPTGAGDSFAAAYLAFRSDGIEPGAAAERSSRFVSALLAERA